MRSCMTNMQPWTNQSNVSRSIVSARSKDVKGEILLCSFIAEHN